ncbi:MAG: hypothetical protein V3T65_06980 [Acidobacteriota bacterium]
MAWSIRNYNTFLREAREQLGITYFDAQDLYAELQEVVERPLFGTDVARFKEDVTAIVAEWAYEEVLDAGWLDVAESVLDAAAELYPEDWLMAGDELEISVDLDYKRD